MFFAIKPYVELCRISNLPTVWTNVLAAAVLTQGGFMLPVFLVLSLSMSLFYSGGMCLNDICDAAADKSKKPFRPIPSGAVSIRHAYIMTAVFFLFALLLLLLVPYQKAVLPGLFLLAMIMAYDRYHKAHPSSVILMAVCRLMIFMVSSVALSGTVGLYVAVAGSAQFLYTIIISVVARFENSRKRGFSFPLIPLMISCISLIDGMVMALVVSPVWIIAGAGGAVISLFGQKYIRGD